GEVLFLSANDNVHGQEIYKSDGTTQGTELLYDFNPGTMPFNPGEFTAIKNQLFFTGYDGSLGFQLYKLDWSSMVSIEDELENWAVNHQFHFYPNPATERINLEANWEVNHSYQVSLLDMTGKTIYSEKISPMIGQSNYSIQLPDLVQGYYLMTILEDSQLAGREKVWIMGK
ncbi:MAG: T9SS type A sorting domain-containing protein, partial [Bacteroidetes bacterium]|nr:T9SS type A sorting domain-containing protein [Bacteroidota bacterium]